MKGLFTHILLFILFVLYLSKTDAQIQTGVWRTPSGNTDYHHFTRNNANGAAVFINQVGSGPILRLSSGESAANRGVKFTVQNNGRVGIGTTSPEAPLHINQSERHKGLFITESDNSVKIYLHLAKLEGGKEYGFFDLGGNTKLRGNGEPSYFDGNVGIGTTNPGTWKLAVNGNIRAKEIKVEPGWSDFVFEEDYALPTLEEVEQHIKEKGHLKDIPSAKEVEENGIFLGEMDAKLLQKIEELTLYSIQQQKQIEILLESSRKQQEEINQLKKQ